ncbi:MAG TPA: plastocyanin/azurin family copper-binding protein [Egicoccus sp.]|nr:plastocyanin/azurin family copper-binding protein [Egicoccus sp.]HSK22634.1 plastocyanin/azurin family copper-binding protein [Egicoccus sp.]
MIARLRRRTPLVAAIVAMVVTYALTSAVQASAADREAATLGPGHVTVTVDMEHSRFVPDRLRVREGTVVTFEVVNHDPIHHEFVLGDNDVHRAHERGSELLHPPVPGEVSTGPNGAGMTFYAFDEPGTVAFACHLPGHAEYGMRGDVEVVPLP